MEIGRVESLQVKTRQVVEKQKLGEDEYWDCLLPSNALLLVQ